MARAYAARLAAPGSSSGKVSRHDRRRNPMWQEGEVQRLNELAKEHRRELRSDEDWADDGAHTRGQQYTWGLEASIQAQHGVNSGAAAVMARRRQSGDNSDETHPIAAGSSSQHAQADGRKRGRGDDSIIPTKRHGRQQQGDQVRAGNAEGESTQEAPNTTRRSGFLVYNTLALQRLETQLQSPYYWRQAPFGDG